MALIFLPKPIISILDFLIDSRYAIPLFSLLQIVVAEYSTLQILDRSFSIANSLPEYPATAMHFYETFACLVSWSLYVLNGASPKTKRRWKVLSLLLSRNMLTTMVKLLVLILLVLKSLRFICLHVLCMQLCWVAPPHAPLLQTRVCTSLLI